MRIICLTGLALALSGCALERSVTFIYYPAAPKSDVFPRQYEFAALAQRECAKYGMVAVHYWDNVTDWDRVRATYDCVTR
jgi:hypothetical protein